MFVESGHTDIDGATLSGNLKGADNATNYALTTATVTKADGTVLENETAVTDLRLLPELVHLRSMTKAIRLMWGND